MTYTAIWETEATGLLSRYLDDPKGVAEVLDAGESLSLDPRPEAAFSYGEDDARLRVGRYRVMYHVDDDVREVHITQEDVALKAAVWGSSLKCRNWDG